LAAPTVAAPSSQSSPSNGSSNGKYGENVLAFGAKKMVADDLLRAKMAQNSG
jgi:hypothetical protein